MARSQFDLEWLFPGGQYVKFAVDYEEGDGLYVIHCMRQLPEPHNLAQAIQAMHDDPGVLMALQAIQDRHEEGESDGSEVQGDV